MFDLFLLLYYNLYNRENMNNNKEGKSMAVAIETWAGYDEEGKEIKRYRAADANADINPEEIAAAIEKVKTACDEQMAGMSDKLTGLTDNALQAMKVEGMTLQDFITSISSVIDSFGSEIANILEPLVQQAEVEHDRLQTQYNSEAESSAASGSASHSQV